jgi:hypothetical protein
VNEGYRGYSGSLDEFKLLQLHAIIVPSNLPLHVLYQATRLATCRLQDYFDQSLDEIKLLRYVNAADPEDEHHIVRLYDFFYYKVRGHTFIAADSGAAVSTNQCC